MKLILSVLTTSSQIRQQIPSVRCDFLVKLEEFVGNFASTTIYMY